MPRKKTDSRVALITDTHFGVRKGSQIFHEYFERFYRDTFFPTLRDRGIDTIIHLGDVFDVRKGIDYWSLEWAKRVVFQPALDAGIEFHIIVGNHDAFYKQSLKINSPELNLTEFPNIHVYSEPQTAKVKGTDVFFIPWICDDNEAESIKTIESTQATIAMGHLEVKGFEMHNGHFNDHGLEKSIFKRFEKVMSGHFHKKSDDGHIYYLGTQYEMTWSDYECPKGFHIFDTQTRELTRIENPNKMFKKIIYNDKETNYDEIDINQFDKCFVKLFVSNRSDNDMFERLMDRLYNSINIHAIDVIEDPTDIGASVREDILEQGEDTLTFLGNYIDQTDIKLDKQKLKQFAKELYMEASE